MLPPLDLGHALEIVAGENVATVASMLRAAAGSLAVTDIVVYVADLENVQLTPLPDDVARNDRAEPEEIATTMAGRAFLTQSPATTERDGGFRIWVPLLEGSTRTGVVAFSATDLEPATVSACADLGLLAGMYIAVATRSSDLFSQHRWRKPVSLAAGMQWDLLPPLVSRSRGTAVAGLVEPAYDVGGDSFDYAFNDDMLEAAIFDAMGHGVGSAVLSALVVGTYRHGRRSQQGLQSLHAELDAVIANYFKEPAFSTGQLVRLDLNSGEMHWTNAGHPLPLLVRNGQVIDELACKPTIPWGLGTAFATVATVALEPGDGVLFYTDGVVEAHRPGGETFGLERLIDLTGQNASSQLPPEEIVRLLLRSVLEHQDAPLADDATLVLMQWGGHAP